MSRPQAGDPLRIQPIRVDEPAQETSRKRPRRLRRFVIGLLITVILLSLASPLALWVRYRYYHVVSRNAVVRGHIADVGVQFSGVVTSVPVDTGDRVEMGQIVARLEDRHLQARVQQARSQLERASRELEVERLAITHERRRMESHVKEATARSEAAIAQVQAAKSRADDASEKYELQRSLAEGGVIPQVKVRDAEVEHRTALALLSAAEAEQRSGAAAKHSAQVDFEGLAVREERIAVLESDVTQMRAELELAEADLKATTIVAPDDGWVVRRIIEPGASVVVGQPIMSLWIGEDLWIDAWIDEDALGQVKVGSIASVTLKPFPDRVFNGVVESIGVSTDYELPDSEVPQPRHSRMRGTPVVCARIRLEGHEETLFPGLSAVVGIRKESPGFLPSLFAREERTSAPDPRSP